MNLRNYAGEWLARLSDGLYPELVAVEAGGTEGVFRVSSQTEQWRAVNLGGESDVLERFLDEVDETDVVWDVGANIGVYSVFVGRKGCSVVAFEPDTQFGDRLESNVRLNNVDDTVSVRRHALGETDTTKTLYTNGLDGTSPTFFAEDDRQETTVEVRAGDEIRGDSPDYVKIDVEGAEANVLRGLETLLQEVTGVLVEIHPERLLEFGSTEEEVREILIDSGLSPTDTFHRDGQTIALFTR